jgi:hypothetical protein
MVPEGVEEPVVHVGEFALALGKDLPTLRVDPRHAAEDGFKRIAEPRLQTRLGDQQCVAVVEDGTLDVGVSPAHARVAIGLVVVPHL